MSDSNRGIRLAAIGAIFALGITALGTGAYFGALYSPHNQQHQAVGGNTGTSEPGQDRGQSLGDIAGIPEPVERAIKNPPAENQQDREQRDLSAQEAMAVWAFWVAFFAGITALITSAGTILIWRQVSLTREAVEDTGEATEAMRDANDIAERSMMEQLRPWIKIVVNRQHGFRLEGDELEFIADIEMHNFGKSPALGLSYFSTLFFYDPTPEELLAYAHKAFDTDGKVWRDKNLFQNDSWPRRTGAVHKGEPPGITKASFVVFARYQTPFDKAYRYTIDVYSLHAEGMNERGLVDLSAPYRAPFHNWFSEHQRCPGVLT